MAFSTHSLCSSGKARSVLDKIFAPSKIKQFCLRKASKATFPRFWKMIEKYKFGFIIIDGKTYGHDVQIFSDGSVKPWWRKTSHEVVLDDVREDVEQNPKIIIFGTGSPGMMGVSEEVKEKIKSRRIELLIEPTVKAIEKFNEAQIKGEKVMGLFHLTC